jgi:hypothetical protein
VTDRKLGNTTVRGRSDPSDPVLPGDVIRVSERYF